LLQPCRIFLSQISSSLHLNFFSFHYLDNEDNGMEYIQEVRKKPFKTVGKSCVKKVRGSQLSVPISFYPRHPPFKSSIGTPQEEIQHCRSHTLSG
jgi:hypothetical protein